MPAPSRWPERLRAAAPLAGPAAIAAAGVAMVAHTWRTWPDVIVDYGRELYFAWQLAEGRTLYVDVAHFNGPLSAYVNALWFRLFGPGILTLALANAALTAGFVTILYLLLVRVASRLAATAACLTFVLLFACGQYTRIGNYNWLCPYSHELPHGLMLAIAALWCLGRYQQSRRAAWMAAVGLATGLLALTKAEVLLAGGAAVVVGLGLTLVAERADVRRAGMLLAVFAAGAAAPLVLTGLWFVRFMPVTEVLRWPLGYWRAVSRPGVAASRFYLKGMGLEDVTANVHRIATVTFWYLVVFGGAAVAARLLGRARAYGAAAAALGFVAAAVVLDRTVSMDGWLAAPRPLPLFMAAAAATAFAGFVRHRREPERASVLALRAALAVLALALLPKMLLNVRIFHYGFVLALPATALLIATVVEWLPAAVERRGGRGVVVRAVALGALVAAVHAHLAFMQTLLDRKVALLGRGVDAIYTEERARPIALLLDEIRKRVAPGETLASVPEGVMLDYLARRTNPTPYVVFDNTTLLLWGEETMIRALATRPPDWIALVDRNGDNPFGHRRFVQLWEWVRANYRVVWQLGTPFAGTHRSSVTLMRRATDVAASP